MEQIDFTLTSSSWLLAQIQREYALALSRFEAVAEGIELAAEQVQDKQIEVLSRPPTVSVGQMLGSTLIILALEAKVIEAFVSKIVPALYRQVLKAGQARVIRHQTDEQLKKLFSPITPGELPADTQKFFGDKILEGVKKRFSENPESIGAEEIRAVNRFLGALTDPKVGLGAQAENIASAAQIAAKTTDKQIGKLRQLGGGSGAKDAESPWGSLDKFAHGVPGHPDLVYRTFNPRLGGDSPAVAIRGIFQELVQSMRYYLMDFVPGILRHKLDEVMITKSQEEAEALMDELAGLYQTALTSSKGLEGTTAEIRDAAFRDYEKVIWALMYGPRMRLARGRYEPTRLEDRVRDDRIIQGVKQDIVLYWWARFPDEERALVGGDPMPFASQARLFFHMKQVYEDAKAIQQPDDIITFMTDETG